MIPTRIGQQCGGGRFTGINQIKSNVYAIIVAPKRTETSGKPFKKVNKSMPATRSVRDGWSNTMFMGNSDYPAAEYCRGIDVGGFADWYLPSRDELEVCYRNLKPTTDRNVIGKSGYTGNLRKNRGINTNSIPIGAAYTDFNPTRTLVIAFRAGGSEAFDSCASYYWSSTEYSSDASNAIVQNFLLGGQTCTNYTHSSCLVRAVRRVLIEL